MVNNLKNKKKKKGFTLIELIIVIAIIAILAAVAIPKFGEVRKNAALNSDAANAKTIANAVTTLIAEDKLTSTSPITINENSDNEVEEYMQNPPSPKSSGYEEYVVTITDGKVSVTMTGTDKTAVNLFPVAATSVD